MWFPIWSDIDEPEDSGKWNLRSYSITRASEVEMESVKFLWEGKIPLDLVTIMGGKGGSGKSTLATFLAAKVSQGTLEGNLYGQPRNVVIYSTEDDKARVITPRLTANGADLDRCLLLNGKYVEGEDPEDEYLASIRLPSDIATLIEVVEDHEAALLVIDPISLTLEGDNDKAQDVQRMLRRLGEFAENKRCSVIGIVHVSKGPGRARDKLLGSTQWHDAARAVLMVEADEQRGCSVYGLEKLNAGELDRTAYEFTLHGVPIKNPDGTQKTDKDGLPLAGSKVQLGGVSPVSVEELYNRPPKTENQPTKVEKAKEWLEGFLADGAKQKTEIDKAASAEIGVDNNALYRASKELGIVKHRLDKFGGGTMWELPFTSPNLARKENDVNGSGTPTLPLDSGEITFTSRSHQLSRNEANMKRTEKPRDNGEKSNRKPHSHHLQDTQGQGEVNE